MEGRTHVPRVDETLCVVCNTCELICPDLAVTKDPATGQPVIDLAFCKGCGVCASVCPKKAIAMDLDRD